MALAITRDRHRVEHIDVVVRAEHGRHDEAPVLLDADDHVVGLFSVRREQLVELSHADETVRDLLSSEHVARLVEDGHIVVGFCPVHSNKNHVITSVGQWINEPEATAAT